MTTNCEVISAFIDDDPVQPEALANALATPEGRSFLIDAIALRGMALSGSTAPMTVRPKSNMVRRLVLAAAVILATLAGFQLGQRQGLNETLRAPEPTRVISAGTAWQEDSSSGGIR